MKRILFSLFLLACWVTCPCHAQGLSFQSAHKLHEEKTSLQLFPEGNAPCFRDSFELSFDFSIWDQYVPGALFLLKDKASKDFFSLTYSYLSDQKAQLRFNTDGKQNHYTQEIDEDLLTYNWMNVSFLFDLRKDRIRIRINGQEQELTDLGLSPDFTPELYFGRHEYVIDVAQFSLRNLLLKDDRHSFFFPLDESEGEDVHDSRGHIGGKVKHPIWTINRSYHWEEVFSFRSSSPCGINYDEDGQRLIGFTQDSLFVHHTLTHQTEQSAYASPLPMKLNLAMSFFHPDEHRLYAYEMRYPFEQTAPSIARLDLDSRQWTTVGNSVPPIMLHHHNGFCDPQTGHYVLFGGFGNQSYSNQFLVHDRTADQWDTLHTQGDFITPRCFSGMAVADHRIYLYGGMGNEPGDQTLGHTYLNDLYEIDYPEMKIRKLWQDAGGERQVSSRNMILSDDGQYLYTLCYPEYLSDTYAQLNRIRISDGEIERMGDSIPFHSLDIHTNINLFYNRKMHRYYCAICDFTTEGTVEATVYSLSAPAVSLAMLHARTPKAVPAEPSSPVSVICLFLGAGLIAIGAVCFRRRNTADLPLPVPDEPKPEPQPEPDDTPAGTEPIKNAIYLFGTFTVIDRHGINISHLFSKRLREVFVYIFLHGPEGVPSLALNEVFWPDKPNANVKNLKGVTINQIRKNLAELDDIDLINEKGYYKLIVGDALYADYFRFTLLKETPDTDELGRIFGRGKFLESFNQPVFDRFKAQTEEFLFSFLPSEIEKLFRDQKHEQVIQLCHILLTADPQNEGALAYTLHSLRHTNSDHKAILFYSDFITLYRQYAGQDYALSFNEVMERTPSFS